MLVSRSVYCEGCEGLKELQDGDRINSDGARASGLPSDGRDRLSVI